MEVLTSEGTFSFLGPARWCQGRVPKAGVNRVKQQAAQALAQDGPF